MTFWLLWLKTFAVGHSSYNYTWYNFCDMQLKMKRESKWKGVLHMRLQKWNWKRIHPMKKWKVCGHDNALNKYIQEFMYSWYIIFGYFCIQHLNEVYKWTDARHMKLLILQYQQNKTLHMVKLVALICDLFLLYFSNINNNHDELVTECN